MNASAAAPTPTDSRESSEPIHVLLVEDEPAFVDALTVGLGREGFEVEAATDGAAGLAQFDSAKHDIILLDVMLPIVSGIDVCREIRKHSSVPIIMVTAKSEEIDTVVGLEVGADDYVSKPYRLRELIARMRAVLRRRESNSDEFDRPDLVFRGRNIAVDIDRHEVRLGGEVVEMPLKEFELLALLIENAGRVLTRGTLIERVWGHDYVGDTKTLDVHIKRLRGRIEADPSNPELIVTIRGLGYKFTA